MSKEGEDLIVLLRAALADVAQALDWQAHGRCRGFSGRLLTSSEAVKVAREAITKADQHLDGVDDDLED